MKIYICSIEELLDAASFDAASLKIDSHRKEKMGRIKSKKDRIRSLCAGLLLNFAVAEYKAAIADCVSEKTIEEYVHHVGEESSAVIEDNLQIRDMKVQELSLQELLDTATQSYEYKQENNGKPYIEDLPEFFFSLSHSGDYVLCAWDLSEIGADLQCMGREIKDSLAKRTMTTEEYKAYSALPMQEQKKEFFKLWTIKESYCKLTGKGLSQDFREIEADKVNYVARLWKEEYWLAVSR